MTESDPTIVPPPGLYQPVRGFGVAWRDEQIPAGYGELVQERLGWAINPEYWWGEGVVQCDTVSYSICYVGGPENIIDVLKPEHSGWFVWVGPTPVP